MNILVTGATGALGKTVLPYLEKHNLVLYVRDPDNVPPVQNAKIIQGTLENQLPLRVYLATNKIDVVINLAAAVNGTKHEILSSNVAGLRELIKSCEDHGIKKFIQISSFVADKSFTFPYARSKRSGEQMLKKSSLDYVVLRPSLMYGLNETKHIMRFLRNIRKQRIRPYLIPDIFFNPVNMDDIGKLLGAIIEKNQYGRITGLVTGPKVSMNNLTSLACKKRIHFTSILPRFFITFISLFPDSRFTVFTQDLSEKHVSLFALYEIRPQSMVSWLESRTKAF